MSIDKDITEEIVEEGFYDEPTTDKEVKEETVEYKKHLVTQEHGVFSLEGVDELDQVAISIPSTPDALLEKRSEVMKSMDGFGSTVPQQEWETALVDGAFMSTVDESLSDSMTEGDWRQGIEVEGKRVNMSTPRLMSSPGRIVTGHEAIARAQACTNAGSPSRGQAWHSGINLAFRAPSEGDLLELYRTIHNDKIKLGRSSYGKIYSNTLVYMNHRLVEFALKHLGSATLRNDASFDNLMDVLVIQDLYPLLNTFAATMYPEGFKYKRACTANIGECTHVEEGVLDLKETVYVDRSKLQDWQRNSIVGTKSASITIDHVRRWQSELLKDRVVSIKGHNGAVYKVTFKSPTIRAYVDSGYRWIENISQMMRESVSLEPGDDQRNLFMRQHSKATYLRQFGHRVDSIELSDGTIINNDEEVDVKVGTTTIEGVLSVMSADDGLREEFEKEVNKFIDESTIALVAVPTYTCKACGASQSKSEGDVLETQYIPLEMPQALFTMIGERVSRIMNR